ncbi:MAG: hypothetical protein EOL86_09170 [Deltaproteobacteria bacterium]|nr:hypothetical protein [Deltaproteobacteria bacterium]
MQNHSSVVQFYFESHEVRALTIDGNPWFVAKDVCEYFGDTNYRRSVSRLDDDEKGVSQIGTQGGGQQMTIVNESGLYSLLFWMQPDKATGKLPQDEIDRRKALIKKFRKWVTAEVLPTIRKTGSYTIPGNGGRRSDIFHHRGPLSDSGLDIRYTMDLTKIVLNPTAANLRMLNRVSGLPVDDLMPQPAAMVNKASQQDLFDRFAAAMIRRDITGQVRFALVYAAFLGWCSANADDAHIPSKKALSSWLHDEGYIRRKPSGVATIYGLRLREV